MIYNLFQYLKDNIPDPPFIVDGWENNDPTPAVLIRQSGGIPTHFYVREDSTVQVESRANSKSICRKNIYLVYNLLYNRYGLILPAITVEDADYPEVKTAQISPIQIPGYIGTDENKNHLYSVNFKITIGGN